MKRALLPSQQPTLATLGENIKYARLRRDLSSEQIAARAGISRPPLSRLKKEMRVLLSGIIFVC